MKQKLSPKENRKAWLYAALIVLGMAALVAFVWWCTTWDLWQGKGTLPPTSSVVTEAAQGLDSITVDGSFDAAHKRLTATQSLTVTNRTGEEQTAVTLRSYTGAYLNQDTSPAATDELFAACYGTTFSTGGLLVDSAKVNGEEAAYSFSDDARTVLLVETPWASGETLTVTLTYHVNVPNCASRFGVSDGLYMLGNVFPTPAVWMDGAYRTDAYVSIGDPFITACANWTVRLTLPRAYTVASTAWATPVITGDTAVYTMEAQTVRDFALVISDSLQEVTGMAGDTMVIAYAKDRGVARKMLNFAKQALACYEARWGDYVYPTFTVTQADFPFGGMEYPRLVMIGSDVIDAGADSLEVTVAHETAHQWWYAMVGSDSWYEPWQDEALCEYALMDYIGQYYGTEARDEAIFSRIETALRITIPRGVTPGSPIDYFGDLTEYGQVVYRRGAALWVALETNLGKDALDDFLRDYAETYRFSIAGRADLTQLLNTHAGRSLDDLLVDYLDTDMN